MNTYRFLLFAIVLYWPWAAQAQHQHGSPTPQAPPSQQQTSQTDMAGMDMSEHGAEHGANLELGFASGTAWQAQSSPEYMWMTQRGGWDLMAHGQLSLTFNHQGGPRGAGKLESMNWLMFMEQRKLGRGTLQFRQMLSAEA